MRVLLTGIAGFIGSHVAEHIAATRPEWEVVGLASFRHRGDPLRIDSMPARYEIHHADLASPLSHRLIDRIGHIDVIINMASESHVDRSIEDPVPFVENNVSLALSMLEYARIVRPQLFVQISTDEVYGPAMDGELHREWSKILPSNPYSASKAAQEAIAFSYWRTYGVPVLITNTMNNFGERQDREKMIPMCISRIATGKTVTIHGSPGNIGSRFYLHARNHADVPG
jgi:dTDP-glucose 4,6-dehydratase